MSTERSPRTILLAIESNHDLPALEAATELAALLRATLHGVFVENTELLRLAQLPFAREISLLFNTAERLQSARLEREFRAQAEQVRRRLAQQALLRSIEWSFRVERGEGVATIAGSGAPDVAVFGRSHPQRRHSAGGTVVAAYDGSPGSEHALELATAMTRDGVGLLVLLPAGAPQLRSHLAAHLTGRAAHAQLLPIAEFSPRLLSEAGRRYDCRLLVLSADTALTPPQLQQLLDLSHCPVTLVH